MVLIQRLQRTRAVRFATRHGCYRSNMNAIDRVRSGPLCIRRSMVRRALLRRLSVVSSRTAAPPVRRPANLMPVGAALLLSCRISLAIRRRNWWTRIAIVTLSVSAATDRTASFLARSTDGAPRVRRDKPGENHWWTRGTPPAGIQSGDSMEIPWIFTHFYCPSAVCCHRLA